MALCRTSSAETLPAGVPAICVPELSTGSRRLSGRFGRRSVQGRRDGSSRYGFRCRLGYASFGGESLSSFSYPVETVGSDLFRDGFSTDLPGASRHSAGAAPCRLGRRSGCGRLLRACRWAFRGPAVRFRFLWPAVVIRYGPDTARYLFSLFVLSMYRFV